MALAAVALLALNSAALEGDGWPRLVWRGEPLTLPGEGPAAAVRIEGDAPAGGLLEQRLEPFPALPGGLARRLVYRRTGPPADLVGADFRLRVRSPADSRRWQCQSFVMVETRPGGPTVCTAFTSDQEFWRVDFPTGENPTVSHHSACAWRLPTGGEATIGTQYLWVVDGDLEAARATTAAFYAAVGLGVADGGPDWFRDAILYQASAGGGVESRFGDVGGFDAFATQLDYLADLGCNALWLQSVTTHKVPENPVDGWNLYGPLRFDQIDPSYGGEAGLARLMAALRRRGFRVIGEIVPHGGTAPEPTARPDWWTYNRDGTRQQHFGQGCDYSAPGWQEVIERGIAWQTRRWGFDGIRVDVADGSGTNWRSPTNGAHASLSTAGGGIGMLQAIRRGQLAGGAREPAIIPETIDERPEYARWGPVGYGFRLSFFLEELQPAGLSAAELKRALTGFFERERGSLPPGMIVLRYLNNHDSVVFWGRADRRFGAGLQRALTGVCCVIDGVPMIYQEQEVGSYEAFRRLFWARRRVPEMRRGDVAYAGLEAPESVFAVLRTTGDQRAVGLVNLAGRPIDATVRLPVPLPDGTVLHDAVSGLALEAVGGAFTIHLGPYATAMLRVGAEPEGQVPVERHHSSLAPEGSGELLAHGGVAADVRADGLSIRPTPLPGGGLRIEAEAAGEGGELALRFLGGQRWLVESVTGPYDDRVVRRHYPWPPGGWRWPEKIAWGHEANGMSHGRLLCERLWHSLVAPLRAGGSILVAGPDGAGLAVRAIATNAANLILSDRSDEPDPSPYGLVLRVVARDPAVNPAWVPGWRRDGWRAVPASDPARAEPLRVRLELVPIEDFAAALAAAAPDSPRASTVRTGPAPAHRSEGRLWLPEPNWVEWSGLALPADGEWKLWIQLRHTERAAEAIELTEHYRLSLDGRPLTFTWDQLAVWNTGNAWFGWARVPLGRQAAGEHALRLETTHTWCALNLDLRVTRDAAWRP